MLSLYVVFLKMLYGLWRFVLSVTHWSINEGLRWTFVVGSMIVCGG